MPRARFFLLLREAADRISERAREQLQAAAYPYMQEKDQRAVVHSLQPAGDAAIHGKAVADDNRARLEQFKRATAAGAGVARTGKRVGPGGP